MKIVIFKSNNLQLKLTIYNALKKLRIINLIAFIVIILHVYKKVWEKLYFPVSIASYL